MLIIENISGLSLDVNDLGLTLAPNESVDLSLDADARDVAASGTPTGDLHSLIINNNITVKDPIDGTTDLIASEGVNAIRNHNTTHYRMPIGGRIADALDVDLTNTGEYLRYDGTKIVRQTTAQIASDIESSLDITNILGDDGLDALIGIGGTSTRLDTWQPLSDGLFYSDFVHGLGTTDIAIHMMETQTNRLVYPEYTEILNIDTIRTVVFGDAEDLIINVISGSGPKGEDGILTVSEDQTPQLGGNLTMANNGIQAGNTLVSQDQIGYLGTLTSDIQSQLNTKTTPTGHTHTFRLPYTWGISGPIDVATGQNGFLLPMFMSLAAGQTASLVGCTYKINDGTAVRVRIELNGVILPDYSNVIATQTVNSTNSTVALSTDAELALVVTSVSGSPSNMSFTLFIEYSQ